jgi:LPXTG-motif cell wall-anchored protein
MRLIALATLLLALALPSAALAQGAGDEQYQDPFGDEQSQQEPAPTPTPAPTQAPAQPAQPSQPQPPPAPEPAPAAPAPAAPAPAATAPSGAGELPYTGAEAGWIALAGFVLLAAGVALRRRAHHQR